VGKEAVLAAFSSLLLGIVQPFCVVTVYSVLGGYFILRLLKEKRLPWPEILRGMVAGAATAPIIAYDYSVYTFNPVLRAWSEQNITPSPPLWAYAIAYGFVFVLVVGGAVLAIRRRSKADFFLLAWVIVNGLLLYAPFSLQRRLVTGLHVPLCILAAMALSRYVLPRFLPAKKTLILGAFIVLTMPSNLFVLMASMAGAAQQDSRLYLYRDEAEAMTWLQENTQPTDIVLASPEMGLFIPAWAGNRVLYGHPFETIEAEKKRALAEMFYQAQTKESIRREIIEGHHITHVFYGSRERALSGGQLETVLMLSEAYTNPGVTIYQVSPVAE
jgi:asparagine N-glycosylation enzyme membrane subunit Stt3